MAEVVRGDIFIVPCALVICDAITNSGEFGYDASNVGGLQVCFEGRIRGDLLDHRIIRSSKFPVELFMGKKEGDRAELKMFGKKVVVRCLQAEYKYNSEGIFEYLLYHLTKSFEGVCDPSCFSPPLPKYIQMTMMVANHQRYARSVGMRPCEPGSFNHSDLYFAEFRKECAPASGWLDRISSAVRRYTFH